MRPKYLFTWSHVAVVSALLAEITTAAGFSRKRLPPIQIRIKDSVYKRNYGNAPNKYFSVFLVLFHCIQLIYKLLHIFHIGIAKADHSTQWHVF